MNNINLRFSDAPRRDWNLILSVSAILVLIVIALNVYTYLKIDKVDGAFTEGESGESVESIDLAELRRAVEFYEDRAEKFESILRSGTSTQSKDPSL